MKNKINRQQKYTKQKIDKLKKSEEKVGNNEFGEPARPSQP